MNRRGVLRAGGLTAAVLGLGGPSALASEEAAVIDPARPIIDAHHHLWDKPATQTRPASRYLLPELLADLSAGHDIVATAFVECGAMYREDGPEALRPRGEVEFVNGVAAMTASGRYGPRRVAGAIVGYADLRLGDVVAPVLDALIAAAPERLHGVRFATGYAPGVIGESWREGALGDARVRAGFAHLARRGLVFDAWCFHTQLGDVLALARAFPDTAIVLDHLGTPLLRAEQDRQRVWRDWRRAMRSLSECENVFVKLGGLGMSFSGVHRLASGAAPDSTGLAALWAPYIETCIEMFGAERCMFESNFPVDAACCNYVTLWNTFKRVTAGCSSEEKDNLFAGVARRVYRIG